MKQQKILFMAKLKTASRSTTLFALAFFCQLSSMAQLQEVETSKANWITVGELKWLSNTKASLKYSANGNDTTYLLYLQDAVKLKNNNDRTIYQYFTIRFSGEDNTLGKLYDLLISFFDNENWKNKQYEKTFRLGSEMVLVQRFPKVTAKAIVLATKNNSIVFTEKELKKLFDR